MPICLTPADTAGTQVLALVKAEVCDSDREQCRFILQVGFAKTLHIGEQVCIQLRRWFTCQPGHYLNQAFLAELLPIRSCRFGDPIGEQHQPVTGRKLHKRIFIFPVWEDAKHCPAVIELRHATRNILENRPRVPCACELQRPLFRVKNSVENGYEFALSDIGANDRVDPVAEPCR